MDIFGIGFSELIFVLIIAMMIFGPRRLPEIAAKAGKFVADLRRMSQGLLTEWQREIAVAGRLEELQQARQDIEAIKQDLALAKQELGQAQKDVVTTAKTIAPPKAAVPSSPAPKTTTPEIKPEPVPAAQTEAVPAQPDTGETEMASAVETGAVQSQDATPAEITSQPERPTAETALTTGATSGQPEEAALVSAPVEQQAGPTQPAAPKAEVVPVTESEAASQERAQSETPKREAGGVNEAPDEVNLANNANHRPASSVEPINGAPSSTDTAGSAVDIKKKETVNE